MQYEGRLYKYAHEPLQLMWLNTEEWMIVLLAYLSALLFDGVAYVISPALAYAAIKYKADKPRGFFAHTQYVVGFKKLQGYPIAQAKYFTE